MVENNLLSETCPHAGLLEFLGLISSHQSKSSSERDDVYWMRRAFFVGMNACGHANPNPPVGCVIVRNNMLLAEGWTQAYGGLHAETHALSRIPSGLNAQGATAYVTLEPCSHQGKQPPCVDALIAAGIKKCVIALKDPHPKVSGSGIAKLLANSIQVDIENIFHRETARWLAPFTHWCANPHTPFIALKWAQTLDGCLADDEGKAKWISGEISRTYTHWLRQRYDAIAIGARTALFDIPGLTVRLDSNLINHRNPARIIVDPRGVLISSSIAESKIAQLKAKTFNAEKNDSPLFYFSPSSPATWMNFHAKCVWIKWNPKASSISDEMIRCLKTDEFLQAMPHQTCQSVLIEGGPTILSDFLDRETYNVAHVMVGRKILGGSKYRISIPPRNIEHAYPRHVGSRNQSVLGEDLLFEWEIRFPPSC